MKNKPDNNTFKIYTKVATASNGSETKSVLSLSTMSTDLAFAATNAWKRSIQCCNDTLAENGALRCRMDTTQCHLPEKPAGKKAKCALHRWVDVEKQAQVLHCRTCNIHLCVDCYAIFHKVPNLIAIKKTLKNKFTHKTKNK